MPNFDEEKLIQSLVELYRQGFLNVLKVILEKEAKKQDTIYFKDILKQIMQILEQLDKNAAKWIEKNVPKIYQQNYIEVMAFIKQLKGEAIQNPSFSQIHQRAVDVLAQNLYDNLRDATQFVGRKFDDYFRKASLEAAGKKYVSGETWQQMKKDLMERLLSKGLTGFKDRLGREWRLDSYAEMVARTLTREAATVATINACKEFDIDLVRISTHYPTCHLCAPIQGKVYSLSGKDGRYPKYGEDGVVIPRHPNCRHVLMPYIRELDPNAEETEKYSNTSLTEDPRSEKEKVAYKEAQEKRKQQFYNKVEREYLKNKKLYDEQARVIIESEKDYSVLIKKLAELRQIEWDNTHWLIKKELILEARKEKELYREKYHVAKHGYTFDETIPRNQKEITEEHITKYKKFLLQTKKNADEIYTFRDPQRGDICWAFIKYEKRKVNLALFNEHMNKDASGWAFEDKEDWAKYLEKQPYIRVL